MFTGTDNLLGADATEPATAPAVQFGDQLLRAAKQFTHGTHRTVSPEQTLARLLPHKEKIGLTRLADITGLDRIGIPTVLAHRPNAPTLANASGKGFTLLAATVSAAMEATEVFHAETPQLPVLHCSYAEIASQYRTIPRDALPLTKHSLFRSDRPEFWVLMRDLLSQDEVAVPRSSIALTPLADQRPSVWMPFAMGTNGLAGGNHLLEALEAALLEVIERDAVTCHTVAAATGRSRFRIVRLETIADPLVRELLARLRDAGIGVVVHDCTSDTGIPCYMAVIWDRWVRHLGRQRGYGAHLDPHVAMIRAITEAVQSRLIYVAGSRDDFFRRDLSAQQFADDSTTGETFESVPATVDASQLRSFAGLTFEHDVAVLLVQLQAVGIEQVLALDLSREDIGVPVVRVVVPSLEGYMFEHYTPGPRARRFITGLA